MKTIIANVVQFVGQFMIVDPMGNKMATAKDHARDILAELDPGLVEQTRKAIACLLDRKQDLYG